MKNRHRWLVAIGLGALVPGAYAQNVHAQSALPRQPEVQRALAPTADTLSPTSGKRQRDDITDKEIIVTGSRIAQNGAQAPTPVTVVGTDQLLKGTPSNIPDALNKLPQFSMSTGPGRVSPGVIALTNVGNYLNLRGVGIGRGLILFDGRRVPATTDTGYIDTNTLPQLLVQRVDIVTAGASAAYGSDAVSGVVNFVLDRNFTGLKAVAQSGISARGDGQNHRLGAAVGFKFADERGHLLLSAEHSGATAIQRSSRSAMLNYYARGGAGTTASPYFTAPAASFQNYNPGSVVIGGGPLQGDYFTVNGLAPTAPGTPIGGGLCVNCTVSQFKPGSDLTPDVDTTQLYGRLSFDVAPAFHPFVDISYARSHYVSNNIPTYTTSQTIYNDNAYLPADAKALLATGGATSFRIGRLNSEFPYYQGDLVSTGLNITAGFDGKVGNGWKYDTYFTHGEGRLTVAANNVLDNQHYFAASDAVRDTSGNIVCRVAITNPGLYPGCVPINLFGQGSPSSQAIAYVTGSSQFRTRNTLDVGAANLSGSLFNLPAGAATMAAGIEYRHQSLLQTSNANPATPPAFTGIRGVPVGSLAYSNTNGGVANGAFNVKEAYLEVEVPIFKDSGIGRSLSLNGAGRVTNYSTSGTVVTWKAGLIYEPIAGLRFRGTRSRDIRAPNLVELFAGLRQSQNTFNDVHTGVNGSIFIQQAGNPSLKPEKADTTTVGIVVQPRALRGFTASVDFYQLKMSDAISTLTPLQINQQCEASNGTSSICAFINRPGGYSDRSAGNYPLTILQLPFNASSLETRGIDFEVSQRLSIGHQDSLSLRLIANYLDKYVTTLSAATPPVDETGILGRPKWSLTGTLDYQHGPLSIGYQGRFYSAVVQDKQFVYVPSSLNVPSYFISDLTVSFDVTQGGAKGTFFLTVNNVFDKQPPIIPQDQLPGYSYPTFQSAYDVFGRTFTAGIRFKL